MKLIKVLLFAFFLQCVTSAGNYFTLKDFLQKSLSDNNRIHTFLLELSEAKYKREISTPDFDLVFDVNLNYAMNTLSDESAFELGTSINQKIPFTGLEIKINYLDAFVEGGVSTIGLTVSQDLFKKSIWKNG